MPPCVAAHVQLTHSSTRIVTDTGCSRYVHPHGSVHNVRVKVLAGAAGGYYLASNKFPQPLPSLKALVHHYANTDVPKELPCRLRLGAKLAATSSMRVEAKSQQGASRRPVSTAFAGGDTPGTHGNSRAVSSSGGSAGPAVTTNRQAVNPTAWYFKRQTKERCTELLKAGGAGCFLLRDSSRNAGFVLMVNEKGAVGAYQIMPSDAGFVFAHRTYQSLAEVVSRGRKSLFTGTHGPVLIMTTPPPGGELFRAATGPTPQHTGRAAGQGGARSAAPRQQYNQASATVDHDAQLDDDDPGEGERSSPEGDATSTAIDMKESPAGVLYAIVNPPAQQPAVFSPADSNAYQTVTAFVHVSHPQLCAMPSLRARSFPRGVA